MLEVATLPFAAADSPSGRELVYLPALLDIMQNYAIASIEKDFSVLGGLSSFATNMSKAKKMDVIFADEDLGPEITDEIIEACFNDKTKVMDIDDVDTMAEENAPETLVSYVIAPADAIPGSFCYKLLIDTQNHELYYFRKHRISKKTGAGFLAEDIKRITASRK